MLSSSLIDWGGREREGEREKGRERERERLYSSECNEMGNLMSLFSRAKSVVDSPGVRSNLQFNF